MTVVKDWLTDEILIVRNLYSEEECDALIALAEEEYGFELASVRMNNGPKMRPDIRDNERVTFTSTEIADEMWSRIQPHLEPQDDAAPVGVDSMLRFYKYSGDQKFKRHKDGVATRDDGVQSKYSYLLYLNENFDGGETVFTFAKWNNGNRENEKLTVKPETGMALLFIHDLWHEGVRVNNGSKYVLRTDVFFQ